MQVLIRNRKRKRNRNRNRKMACPNPWLSRDRFSEFNKPLEKIRHEHDEEEEGGGDYANRRPIEDIQDKLGFKEIIDIKDDDAEDDYDDDIDLQLALFYSSISCSRNKDKGKSPEQEIIDVKKKGIVEQSLTLVHRKWGLNQAGESSVSHCVICNDTKSSGLILRANKCGHPFCEDCIRNYIGEKLQDDILVIKCPEAKCKNVIERRFWQQFVPERLSWLREHALTEGSVLAMPQTFRCPFEDCLEPIVDDKRQFLIRACPNCWKIFCAKCMVSCHKGMTCKEFRRLKQRQETLTMLQPQADPVRQLLLILIG